MVRRLLAFAAAAALALPGAVAAQGNAVPAYEPPPPVAPPVRSQEVHKRKSAAESDAKGKARTDETAAQFAAAYAAKGKPRLAFFWNRALSDTLSDWYADTRVTQRTESGSKLGGDITLDTQGNAQTSMQVEQRVKDRNRQDTTETFEWEFQDGFLGPFLDIGATVVDRAAIVRLTGADMTTDNARTVEVRALQGKADYLAEVLISRNERSRTGYELRARVLDVRTGAIVGYVNSKGLKEWSSENKQWLAGPDGFTEDDPEGEMFGPVGDDHYTADGSGFHRKRKPPKPKAVGQSMAYNLMAALTRQWK
ncbi:MAG: hypothetical protein HY985_07685 [Magnetospirillum sp.]|nr:hypothetical protein [Magnetospirillum sp.]